MPASTDSTSAGEIISLDKLIRKLSAQRLSTDLLNPLTMALRVDTVPWKGDGAPALPEGVVPYDATTDPDTVEHREVMSIKYARGMDIPPHLTLMIAKTAEKPAVDRVRKELEKYLKEIKLEIVAIDAFSPRPEVAAMGAKGYCVIACINRTKELMTIYNGVRALIDGVTTCYGPLDQKENLWRPHITIGYFTEEDSRRVRDWASEHFSGCKISVAGWID